MTIYNDIFNFILSLPTRRARIIFSDHGWTVDGMPPSKKLASALRSLLCSRVPDGTQIDGMWIWTPAFNERDKFLKFSYRDHLGNVRTSRINSCTFSH